MIFLVIERNTDFYMVLYKFYGFFFNLLEKKTIYINLWLEVECVYISLEK
jgi:hypothetical protein